MPFPIRKVTPCTQAEQEQGQENEYRAQNRDKIVCYGHNQSIRAILNIDIGHFFHHKKAYDHHDDSY